MRFKINLISVLLLMMSISACSTQSVNKSITENIIPTPAPTASVTPSPTVAITPTASPKQDKTLFTASFGGDVMFDTYVKDYIDKNGISNYIEDIAPVFKSSDLSLVNLETSISTRGEKEKDKQFTFRADPKYLQVLQNCGIYMVSLANNHSLDFGVEALEDTFSSLNERDITYIGAGRNMDEAAKATYVSKNNLKLAFIGSSRVIPVAGWNAGSKKTGVATTYDPAIINAEIKKAKAVSDFVICYIHWGEEGKNMPVDHQKQLAHSYIDNGADVVIGSHPHVLQGIEYYKDKLIIYSLGNLIFTDMYKKTAIATVTFDSSKKANLKITPFEIINFKPTLIKDEEKKKQFYKELAAISFGVKIDEKGNISK